MVVSINQTKLILPNQTNKIKPTKPNLPNPTYKTKPAKANLLNQTKLGQTKPKLLVKAVDALVRSTLAMFFFAYDKLSDEYIIFDPERKENLTDQR